MSTSEPATAVSCRTPFELKGKTAHEQFVALVATSRYSGMDFVCEMAANQFAVFLNFFFWQQESFVDEGISDDERDVLLGKFKTVWVGSPRAAPLGVVRPRRRTKPRARRGQKTLYGRPFDDHAAARRSQSPHAVRKHAG